jgi:hypothetical protein
MLWLLWCIAVAPAAAPSEQPGLDGLPIVRIVFQRSDIFDTSKPETSAWFFRWANALHIVSKEGFLRQMILFAEGDAYSSRKVAESERIMRNLGYLNPVHITAEQVEDGVEVTVATHDKWTLEVGASFGLFGDRDSVRVEFQENHFIGWGKMVELEYRSDVERDTWRYRYFDPNVLGSRWLVNLIHEDTSDGYRDLWLVERPFFSLDTTRSWGAWWTSERITEHLYSESESVVDGRRTTDAWRAWVGFRLSDRDEITRRLSVGWDDRRDRFRDWMTDAVGTPHPTPGDRTIAGPRVAFEQVLDRFVVLQGFRTWTAQEDVALGPNIRLGSTLSLPEFGGDLERVLVDGSLSVARSQGSWLITGDGWFEGRFDSGDPANWLVGVQVTATELGSRGWQLRLYAETSHELDLDRQLTLGADVGLRGWDPDFFDGTGRAFANAQWRTLLKEDLFHILSLGVVLFADTGVTWDPRVGRDTDGVRTDVGVGLLADLTTVGIGNLLRLEVAFPDDGSGPTVLISSEALF